VADAVAQFASPATRLLSDVDLSHYFLCRRLARQKCASRDERLAAKYSVVLSPVTDESQRYLEHGYIVRKYRFVIGGLENVDPKDIKIVLPFAWPFQPEEWQLGYWLERDYRMFVLQESLLRHPVAACRFFLVN
jgi:hypothetical protein